MYRRKGQKWKQKIEILKGRGEERRCVLSLPDKPSSSILLSAPTGLRLPLQAMSANCKKLNKREAEK
ncbi:hypothetical protein M5689_009177 [Euphorbia peplus]|nr:hypothetical protein M5689_009177 [Euphorbia peplus]